VVSEDLHKRLAKDDRLHGAKIDFDYDGATVVLSGTVKDKEQYGWASTVAAGTPGVKGVINRLQVETPPTPSAPAAPTLPEGPTN
jgi:osmotically-inducible protein OsmY